MARRYQPVLLAARMQYRLRQVEEALQQGDTVRADQQAAELADLWNKYGHVAGEAGARLEKPLRALCITVSGLENGTDLQSLVRELDVEIRQMGF